MFLRQFSMQIDANLYAIKGGCNLRFFFGSVRYSEDLDLDVCTIAQETLENKVTKLLASPSLLRLLQGYGVSELEVTAPKQTPTTQRWKIQLHTEQGEMPYHTKIEFSRRNKKIQTELASIDRILCQSYRLPPMRLSHYGLSEAIMQKVLALAHRSLTQARDIFDLYFLLHRGKTNSLFSLKKEDLAKAEEALLSINFADYKSQVVTFLEPEEQAVYDSKDYWSLISNEVFQYINGLGQ
ncbi:MAG: nucleotidyl transferase AbiEii/AbiGii toxin family protein [Gammaproteobacteria bacterium]